MLQTIKHNVASTRYPEESRMKWIWKEKKSLNNSIQPELRKEGVLLPPFDSFDLHMMEKNVNSTQNSACHKCAVGTFGPKEQSGIMYIMIHPLMVAWDWHVLCWEPACGNGGKCSLEFRPRESELFWWINMSSWQIYLLMLFKFSFLNYKMVIKECFYHTVDVRIR